MASVGDAVRQDTTPNLQELSVGSNVLYHGDKPLTHGFPAGGIRFGEPLTPARIIVRSARRASTADYPDGMPAYAVYQPGMPTLPSVVFEISGTEMLDALAGNRPIRQTFIVSVRAKRYADVDALSTALMNELRKDPSGRVREVGASTDDGFAQDFEFRFRSFSVVIQM